MPRATWLLTAPSPRSSTGLCQWGGGGWGRTCPSGSGASARPGLKALLPHLGSWLHGGPQWLAAIITVTSPRSLLYEFLFKVMGTFLKPGYHPVSHLKPLELRDSFILMSDNV